MSKNSLVWLDPSLENVNAGDEIIASAVAEQLSVPDDSVRITTHRRLRRYELRVLRGADTAIVGGTNIINSRLLYDRQWPMPPWQIAAIWGKLVFVGSGWWQYQRPPGPVTARVLRGMSHSEVPHAVRDQYTATRFAQMGIPAIMTGCPTMWGLDGATSRLTPGVGAVVATLTDYHLSPTADAEWLTELGRVYDEVLVVGMGPGDHAAFQKLGSLPNVRWFGFGTAALTSARGHATDFIGTRLHAAVRWIQAGGAALVLSVDNRATEIGRDCGLPVIERGDIDGLRALWSDNRQWRISMPIDAIRTWKSQWAQAFTR